MKYRALLPFCFSLLVLIGVLPINASAERPHIDTAIAQLDGTEPGPTDERGLVPRIRNYSSELPRYDDPREAVRRKAEARAWQRQQRIALMKAFGLSKQRPLVYSTPFQTYYSPWNQYGYLTVPVIVVVPQRDSLEAER